MGANFVPRHRTVEWAVEDSNLWTLARHADECRSPPFARIRKPPTTWDFDPPASVLVHMGRRLGCKLGCTADDRWRTTSEADFEKR